MSKPTLTRRELFTFFRRKADPPPEKEPATSAPKHVLGQGLRLPLRPPGALAEEDVADQCQRCNKCMEVCPVQAIVPLPNEYGPWAGTPHIVARTSPCVMCDDLVCNTVCPTGTLRPLGPTEELRIGTAQIDPSQCLPFKNGEFCDLCAQSCPEPLAITFNNQGHPRVSGYHCTGCGLCERACPTEEGAIRVIPVQTKPRAAR